VRKNDEAAFFFATILRAGLADSVERGVAILKISKKILDMTKNYQIL